MPDLVVVEGFEHGVTANGTGGNLYQAVSGSPSIIAALQGSGSRAKRFTPGAGGTATDSIDLPSAGAVLVGVLYLKLSTLTVLGATKRDILRCQSAGTADADASLGLRVTGGNTKLVAGATDSTTNIVTGQVYRVEFRMTLDGANCTIDWKIDGVAQTQAVGAFTAATFSRLRYGALLAGTDDIIIDFDDIGISQTSGDFPIGDIEIVSLAPSNIDLANSNTPTDFQTDGGIDPVAGDSSKLTDAPITGGLTTWIAQDVTGTGKFLQLDMADPSGTPLGVSVSAAVTNDASATCRYEFRSRQSDTTEVATQATINPTTAGAYLRHFIPPPSGGWTAQKLTDLVLRFGYSTDVTPLPRFSAFMISYARNPNVKSGATQIGVGVAAPAAGAGTRKGVAVTAVADAATTSQVPARSGASIAASAVAGLITAAAVHKGVAASSAAVASPSTIAAIRQGAAISDVGVAAPTMTLGGHAGATLAAVAVASPLSVSAAHQGATALALAVAAPVAVSGNHQGATVADLIAATAAQGLNVGNMKSGTTRLSIGLSIVICARRSRHGMAVEAGTTRRGMANPAGTSRRGQPTPDC